jgi:hypothetical protein
MKKNKFLVYKNKEKPSGSFIRDSQSDKNLYNKNIQ